MTDFDYSNLSGRPPGPVLRWGGRILPGVRQVQRQVAPYAAAWEAHNRESVAAEGPLWVTLGDSMAQGIGASRFDRGWAGQLATHLPSHRHINLSVSGGRVSDVVDRQLPVMRALCREQGAEPDLITVLIGSNDLFSPRLRPLLSAALATMLAELPPGAVIGTQLESRQSARDYNKQVEQAAAGRGLVIAEFRDPRTSSWRGKLAADRFHPNDRGYAAMAEIFAEAVAGARIAPDHTSPH